jgi:hypothetical protein
MYTFFQHTTVKIQVVAYLVLGAVGHLQAFPVLGPGQTFLERQSPNRPVLCAATWVQDRHIQTVVRITAVDALVPSQAPAHTARAASVSLVVPVASIILRGHQCPSPPRSPPFL